MALLAIPEPEPEEPEEDEPPPRCRRIADSDKLRGNANGKGNAAWWAAKHAARPTPSLKRG
jgi:hypothetical protein